MIQCLFKTNFNFELFPLSFIYLFFIFFIGKELKYSITLVECFIAVSSSHNHMLQI